MREPLSKRSLWFKREIAGVKRRDVKSNAKDDKKNRSDKKKLDMMPKSWSINFVVCQAFHCCALSFKSLSFNNEIC
jgi:hypothetical protein